ncbi:MAG: hypothetical protein J5J06_04595 [Phycisphaerae bacterium]|nr:hypothetical protein [Phycisphaerae bacterium]
MLESHILDLLFPIRVKDRLTPEEYAVVAPTGRRMEKRYTIAFLVLWFHIGVILALVPLAVDMGVRRPVEPVYDEISSAALLYVCGGFFGGMALAHIVAIRLVRRMAGMKFDLYIRYWSEQSAFGTRYSIRRAMPPLLIFAGLIGLAALLGGAHMRQFIDSRGISYSDSLFTFRCHPFSEVRRVEIHDVAPIANHAFDLDYARLTMRLAGGTEIQLGAGSSVATVQELRRIGEYVARQSRLPLLGGVSAP